MDSARMESAQKIDILSLSVSVYVCLQCAQTDGNSMEPEHSYTKKFRVSVFFGVESAKNGHIFVCNLIGRFCCV